MRSAALRADSCRGTKLFVTISEVTSALLSVREQTRSRHDLVNSFCTVNASSQLWHSASERIASMLVVSCSFQKDAQRELRSEVPFSTAWLALAMPSMLSWP